jgi:hypothetical protein
LLVGSTTAEVRLELAKEEAEEAKRGEFPPHDVSPNMFLAVGLELEEQQYVLSCLFIC